MSEGVQLFKVIAMIGLFSLFIFAMSIDPGTGVSSISAWTELQNTMSAGVSWPVFNDPYIQRTVVQSLFPDGVGPQYDRVSATGCSDANYYLCVTSNDGNTTYLEFDLDVSFSVFLVNMTDPPEGSYDYLGVQVNAWCASGSGLTSEAHFGYGNSTIDYATEKVICQAGNTSFGKVSLFLPDRSGVKWNRSLLNDLVLGMSSFAGEDDGTLVTFINAEVHAVPVTVCTGNWFEVTGCQLGQFVLSVFLFFLFIINAVVYILQVIVSVGAFVVALLVGISGGIFGTLTWVTGNISNPFVFMIFSVVFIGFIVWFTYIAVKLIRGSGPI